MGEIKAIEEIQCESVSEFLGYLRKSGSHWWNGNECKWIFRGHSNAAWPLLPTAWRPLEENRLKPIIDELRNRKLTFPEGVGTELTLSDLDYWVDAETIAIHHFAELGSNLGYKIERMTTIRDPLQSGELIVYGGLRSRQVYYSGDVMATAQHHGIPTRYLDWTTDPINAAFFAVNTAKPENEALCVWAFHPDQEDRLEWVGRADGMGSPPMIIQVFEQARYKNNYLHSQSGLFTTINCSDNGTGAEQFFEQNGKWPTIEDYLNQEGFKPISPSLRKITLRSEYFDELSTALYREDMNLAKLMPTLDNVAKTVMDRWRRL